jgi:hypothetical protein
MTRVQAAEQQLAQLNQELTAIEAAITDLTQQHAAANGDRDALYAVAERNATEGNVQAAQEAEQQAQALEVQLRRKRAAQQACVADLEAARQELQAAKQQELVGQIEGVYDEVVGVVRQLDENIGQPVLWGQLLQLTQLGNALYGQVAQELNLNARVDLFVNAGVGRQRAFHALSLEIDKAWGQIGSSQVTIFPTLAEGLDLNLTQRRINHLRQQVNR